jgi:arginase
LVFHPYELEPSEQAQLEHSAMLQYPVTSLAGRAPEFAAEARASIEERAGSVVLHFDVDVMDSAEIPLANWPHYNALFLGEAVRCLSVFVATPKLAAIVLTEINPDHDPDGLLIRRFVDAFSGALRPLAAPAARGQ